MISAMSGNADRTKHFVCKRACACVYEVTHMWPLNWCGYRAVTHGDHPASYIIDTGVLFTMFYLRNDQSGNYVHRQFSHTLTHTHTLTSCPHPCLIQTYTQINLSSTYVPHLIFSKCFQKTADYIQCLTENNLIRSYRDRMSPLRCKIFIRLPAFFLGRY